MAEEYESLYERMKKYAESDMVPFHMPGHKRRTGWKVDPYAWDITEVEGFDDLHHARGVLKEAMDEAAGFYGSDHTWFLVNGSTAGILAAVSATVPFGGKLILARNCHRSAYHAAILNRLKTVEIYPQMVDKLGICGGISPKTVDNLLNQNADAAAVLLVSPTYEGVLSDIQTIAEIVHRHGIPLLVDEAHGAHFPFTSRYRSALDCGADVVVQSLHKTLPALTQTAVLHVKGPYVDVEKMERYLQIYQSSSPSYILLGSIEAAVKASEKNAPAAWEEHFARMEAFREGLGNLSCIRLPSGRELQGSFGIFDFDESRLILSVKDCYLSDQAGEEGRLTKTQAASPRPATGKWLASVLRRRYHLETEMAAKTYALAITTPFDSEEGLARLAAALRELDGGLLRVKQPVKRRDFGAFERSLLTGKPLCAPKAVLTMAEALDAPSRPFPLEDSVGHIAAEFAYLYPPGIPLILPGEEISAEAVRTLLKWREEGFTVQGLADQAMAAIKVVEEDG